jgi:hypothetical protein
MALVDSEQPTYLDIPQPIGKVHREGCAYGNFE